MNDQELETVFAALAGAIESAGGQQSELLLAKIALALSDEIDDANVVLKVINECMVGLNTPPNG